MADAHETDRPTVTAADAVRDLFVHLPQPGRDIVWLVDQLLGVAQHLGSVTLERVHNGESHALVCRAGSEPSFSPGRDALRLFRPLLARLAVLGTDETGTECGPYGGRYALVRSSRSGPVQLEIEFTNTPATQRLGITRVPAPVAPRTTPSADSGPVDDVARSPA